MKLGIIAVKGGSGSGNWAHTGRPGLVGGSGGGGMAVGAVTGAKAPLAKQVVDSVVGPYHATTTYDLLAKGIRYAGKGNKWDMLTSDELKLVGNTLDDLKSAGRAAQRGKNVRSPAHRDILKWGGWSEHMKGMSDSERGSLRAPMAKLVDVMGADEIFAHQMGYGSARHYYSEVGRHAQIRGEDPTFASYYEAKHGE